METGKLVNHHLDAKLIWVKLLEKYDLRPWDNQPVRRYEMIDRAQECANAVEKFRSSARKEYKDYRKACEENYNIAFNHSKASADLQQWFVQLPQDFEFRDIIEYTIEFWGHFDPVQWPVKSDYAPDSYEDWYARKVAFLESRYTPNPELNARKQAYNEAADRLNEIIPYPYIQTES